MITNELLLRFKNNLGFSAVPSRITWDDKFAICGAKIGDTLRLRDAVEFTVGPRIRTSPVRDSGRHRNPENPHPQPAGRRTRSILSSAELTLSIDAFSDRYFKSPRPSHLQTRSTSTGSRWRYQSTGNQVGTPGTPIAALDPFWIAGETLDVVQRPDGRQTHHVYQPESPDRRTRKPRKDLFQSCEPGEAAVRARPHGHDGRLRMGHGPKRQNPYGRPAAAALRRSARPARRAPRWPSRASPRRRRRG